MNANQPTRTNEQAIQNLKLVVSDDRLRFLNPREVLEVLQCVEQLEKLIKSLTPAEEKSTVS